MSYILKIFILLFIFNISLFGGMGGMGGGNNAPVIKDPTDQTTWETDYNENDTSKVTTIQADDDDGDDITYKIKDGDDSNLFDIDGSSGDLTFKNSPDYENPQDDNTDNDYIVTVIADDGSDTDELKITIHVKDVDDAKASIEDNEIKETNGDQTLTFKITLDSTNSTDVSIDWSLSDDTAKDSEDYVKTNGTVTISAGDTEATFNVTIKGDEVDEDTETFNIHISSSDVQIDDADGVGTIKDDDGSNCTQSGTIDLVMKDGYGDAEQQGNDVDHSSSDLEMMYDDSNEQKIGMVFEGVDIEQGCYVKKAYIQYISKSDKKNDTSVVIYGEDEDNATNYKDDRKITDATKTEKSVTWKNIPDWSEDQKDEDTRTPQISCIVEHIIQRDNWQKNNNMGFILIPPSDCDSEDCNRRAYSGNEDEDQRPILHIEYSDKKEDSRECKQIASIEDNSIQETDSDQTLTFKITLDSASSTDVSIDWSLSDDTATDGEDYVKTNGTVTIKSGDTKATFDVTIKGDKIDEDTETFNIHISSSDVQIDDADGVGTIRDKLSTGEYNDIDNYYLRDGSEEKKFKKLFCTPLNIWDNDGAVTIESDDASITQIIKKDNYSINYHRLYAQNINVTNGDGKICGGGSKACEVESLSRLGDQMDVNTTWFDSTGDTDLPECEGSPKKAILYNVDSNGNQIVYKGGEYGDCIVEFHIRDDYYEKPFLIDGTFKTYGDSEIKADFGFYYIDKMKMDGEVILRINDDRNNFWETKKADFNITRMYFHDSAHGYIWANKSTINYEDCNDDGDIDDDDRDCQKASEFMYWVDPDSDVDLVIQDGVQMAAYVYNGGKITFDEDNDGVKNFVGAVSGQNIDIDNAKTKIYWQKPDPKMKLFLGDSDECKYGTSTHFQGGDVDFFIINPPETRNIQGNYVLGGNMILCRADDESAECESHKGTNNEYMKYIDIDNDNTTYNSSSFTLDTPDGSKIIWAGLYWGGFIHNTKNDSSDSDDDWQFDDKIETDKKYNNGPGLDLTYNAYDTDKVKFKHPKTNEYIDVNATTVYFSKYGFSGFANITKIFTDNEELQNNPDGIYTLANMSTNHKKIKNHGNSGGWSMVVIYENDGADYKNVTVFNGWKEVDNSHPVDINISGFLIPDSDKIKAKVSFVSIDGDGGDCSFKLNDTKIGIWTDQNGKEHDDRDEVFNSTIVGVPLKNPDFDLTDDRDDYYSSFEIDTYDASGILEAGDTSANIKFEMDNEAAFEVPLIIFSADMYTPRFCYDYAYKQDNTYFTEENNGTQIPRIIGRIDKDKPVDVELYLRNNEDSDLEAVDFRVDVEDINTTQSIYERETTWVTQPNSKKRITISDDDINVSDEYDKNISINNIGSKDYFYIGYSLDPSTKDINISINGYAKYNLILDSKKIILPRVKMGGERIPICTDSNIYNINPGLFNVVHNNYYDNDNGDKFYNLPTQVTSRQGNFDIISIKKHSEELKNRTTIVAIEMVNIDVFHDTQASCDDMANRLSSRLWVTFDNNVSKIKFDKDVVPNSFYAKANKNTAFRISFNSDENGSIIKLENDDDNYKIKNYDSVINPNNDDCLNENGNKVVDECGEDGDSISKDKLIGCMECIFKRQTVSVCSRDNFAIRPEALYMRISDQNQTDKTNRILLNGENLNLASGYNYFMEINATNHKNNDSSKGYNNSLDLNLTWDSSKTGCNDESNSTFKSKFNNGKVTFDIYKNNIGKYNLSILDNNWANVDMKASHHIDDGNFTTNNNNYDCIKNSHIVADTGVSGSDNTPLNGCEISSNHNNTNDDDDTIEYKNYNLTFHPYKFQLDTIIESSIIGDFIYMSNLENGNMSVNVDTNISAKGYNNLALNNFVTGCYAEDLNMQILKTRTTNGDEEFKYLFHNTKKDGTIISSDDINHTLSDADEVISILLKSDFFKKDRNGTISTKTYLNFDRERDTPQNPEDINFTKLILNSDTNFNANLTTKKAESNATLDKKIMFYYGRSHTTRQRYIGDMGTAYITYEVYCNNCNKSLLTSTKYTDNPKWFINIKHDKAEYGTVGNIKQKMNNRITEIASTLESSTLRYDESRGYPYKTTMTHQAPEWLIYDKYNIGINNEFEIEFMRKNKSWVGEHKTETTTSSEASRKTNRRVMW